MPSSVPFAATDKARGGQPWRHLARLVTISLAAVVALAGLTTAPAAASTRTIRQQLSALLQPESPRDRGAFNPVAYVYNYIYPGDPCLPSHYLAEHADAFQQVVATSPGRGHAVSAEEDQFPTPSLAAIAGTTLWRRDVCRYRTHSRQISPQPQLYTGRGTFRLYGKTVHEWRLYWVTTTMSWYQVYAQSGPYLVRLSDSLDSDTVRLPSAERRQGRQIAHRILISMLDHGIGEATVHG